MSRTKLSIGKGNRFRSQRICVLSAAGSCHPGRLRAKQPDILVLIDQPSQKTQDFTPLIAEAASYKLGNLGLASQVVSATSAKPQSPLPRIRASGASAALVCSYQVDGGQMVVHPGLVRCTVRHLGRSCRHEDRGSPPRRRDSRGAGRDSQQGRGPESSPLSARRASENRSAAKATAAACFAAGACNLSGSPDSTLRPSPAAAPFPSFRRIRPVSADRRSQLLLRPRVPSLPARQLSSRHPCGARGRSGSLRGWTIFGDRSPDSSDNYLIPLGLDVRYEIGAGGLRPFFIVVGGPALLVMVTGTQGTLVDVLPFLKSGIGLEVDIGPRMGVSALVGL